MKRKSKWNWIATLAVAGWVCLPGSDTAQAQDSTRQLRSSVTKMNDWLADSQHAPSWRRLLDLGTLDTAAGLGAKANLQSLIEVRNRFFNQQDSAISPNFDSVRRALDLHIDRINKAEKLISQLGLTETSFDQWKAAFSNAAESFGQMTSAELNSLRTEALVEAKLLRDYVQWRGPIKFDPSKDPIRSFLAKHPEAKSFTTEKSKNQFELEYKLVDRLIEVLEKKVVLPFDKSTEKGDVLHYQISDHGTQKEVATGKEPSSIDPRTLLGQLKKIQSQFRIYSKLDPTAYSLHTITVLDQYVDSLSLGQYENMGARLKRTVKRIVRGLDQWKVDGNPAVQANLARSIGFLQASGQCPDLVMAFQRTYWRPATRIFVSERLANRFARRPVNDSRAVDEKILKNQVYGTATTNGLVSVDFVPNPRQATISLYMNGSIHSDNYSPVGPITVYTGSNGQMEARRNVHLNFGGFYEKSPYASVDLQSYFKGTSCGMLITRLAESQFQKQQFEAESIAEHRAESRLLKQFGSETNQAFAEGRARAKASRSKLAPLMPYRPSIFLVTDQNFLRIYGSKARINQVPPLSNAPELDIPCDLAFQVHESLLINLLEDHFSKFSIDSDRLDEMTNNKTSPDENRASFQLTLTRKNPIQIKFQEQMLTVRLNIQQFQSKGQTLSNAHVEAKFKLTFENKGTPGIRLRQIGRVQANLAEGVNPTLMSTTMLELIESTVNQQLEAGRKSQKERGIKLPMNLLPVDKIPNLANLPNAAELIGSKLVVASFKNGWLELAWRLNDIAPGEAYPTRVRAIATEKQFKSTELELDKQLPE